MRLILILALGACAKREAAVSPELEVERQEAPSPQYSRADTIPDDAVPGDVADYRREVRKLFAAPIDPTHKQVVATMNALAEALDAVPRAPDILQHNADRVRDFANMVESSEESDVNHTRWVREALLISAQAMDELDIQRIEGLSDSIKSLRTYANELDPTVSLGRQRITMLRAFDAASDALVLASYERPYGAGTR